jgi:hypothetical protein
MRYVYISLIVLVSAIVLVFTIQNLPTVTVHFVTLRLTLPQRRESDLAARRPGQQALRFTLDHLVALANQRLERSAV